MLSFAPQVLRYNPLMAPDIFLRYSRADYGSPHSKKGFITRLMDHLKVVGRQKYGRDIDIFRADNLAAGVQWEKELFESLRGSWIFLPIFSPSWMNSQFCRREWDTYWEQIRTEFRVGNQT